MKKCLLIMTVLIIAGCMTVGQYKKLHLADRVLTDKIAVLPEGPEKDSAIAARDSIRDAMGAEGRQIDAGIGAAETASGMLPGAYSGLAALLIGLLGTGLRARYNKKNAIGLAEAIAESLETEDLDEMKRELPEGVSALLDIADGTKKEKMPL